jgi:uncharacterized FlaG/YvyC family protein
LFAYFRYTHHVGIPNAGPEGLYETGEVGFKPIVNEMNIEKQNASLMPALHQRRPVPDMRVVSTPQVTGLVGDPVPDSAGSQARAAEEAKVNQRRIALAEKMIGANKSLVIEKDANRVGFVYKTIDRTTGEVVRVWPQREVATALQSLSDNDAQMLMSGMIVDAKA